MPKLVLELAEKPGFSGSSPTFPKTPTFEESHSERIVDMSHKAKSQEKRAAIRRILMSEWDPIGVNDTPAAADEYDGYIGPVLDLLNARA